MFKRFLILCTEYKESFKHNYPVRVTEWENDKGKRTAAPALF